MERHAVHIEDVGEEMANKDRKKNRSSCRTQSQPWMGLREGVDGETKDGTESVPFRAYGCGIGFVSCGI